MKGSIKRYCACLDPATKKQYGAQCPALKSDSKHGHFEYRDRFKTSGGYKPFRRRGFGTKKAAGEFRTQVYELIALAKGDDASLARIGDLVFEKTTRGGQLPDPGDVRRRLGVGGALDRSMTTGEWLTQWLAGKRSLRPSVVKSYGEHIHNYLLPILGLIPLDRLNAAHISDMFDLIEEWNDEIRAARAAKRRPVLDRSVRKRPMHVGPSTQRRIYATLRNALGDAWKARRVEVNEALFVELPPEDRQPARVWSPEQVATFLDYVDGHRLAVLYRLILLRGLRRGEATGARWMDLDLDDLELRVTRPLLQFGGKVVESKPKTRAGERLVVLDKATAALLKRLRTTQKRERLQWGEAYNDTDLVFTREDGTGYQPDYVSKMFIKLSADAGLPRITLHEGRHTAASLALEAGADIKVVSDQLGHSTTTITRDLYQHVRKALHDGAAEAVVRLLPDRHGSEAAG